MKKLLLTILLPLISWADEQADSAMRQHIDLLRNISTKEQADAAADKISNFVHPENATAELYDAMAAEYEKLYSSCYYGSARLAEALEADAEDAVLPAPLTPDVLAELEERMRRSFAALLPGMRAGVSGGPGLTRETAWVYTAPHRVYEEDGSACYDFNPAELIGGEHPHIISQRELQQNGKLYQVYTVAVFHLGHKYEITIWMDTTSSPPYDSQAEYRAGQPCLEGLKAAHIRQLQRVAILKEVNNRLTADKAAEYLKDLNSNCHKKETDPTLDSDENEILVKEILSRYCYGSVALAEQIGCKLDAYEPRELTPEVADALEQRIRHQLEQSGNPLFAKVSGGPGFTRETAWRIPAEMRIDNMEFRPGAEDSAYFQFWQIVTMQGSDSDDELLGIGTLNGRYYTAGIIRLLYEGSVYRFPVWRDKSDGRIISSASEFYAAESARTRYLKEKAAILKSIQDTASADAAAARLRALQAPTAIVTAPFRERGPDEEEQIRLQDEIILARESLYQAGYHGSDALCAELWEPKFYPMSALTAEARKIRDTREMQETLAYVRLLEQELPLVNNRESAMAAARKLYAKQGFKYNSHILLLQRDSVCRQINTKPIRRHLSRIRKAGYYGSVDLADILVENIAPNASGYDAPPTDPIPDMTD